ncbi:hypothetical protein F5X99DRAFT_400479 [Biscogniauxia marginata]|nr:hypothetical protein F5X99DRAFT_400479 [Biscogniauxia marginata]
MVGVRRSKGCNTCRRKKIKCDEQRLRCGQCRKGVRICDGYDQPTIFLNSSTGDYENGTLPLGEDQIRFRNRSVDDYAWPNGDKTGRVVVSRTKQRSWRGLPYGNGDNTRETVPAPRCLSSQTWSIDQILGEFLDNCLHLSASQEVPLSWIRSLVPMEKDVDALPLAMSALAFGWAGHVDGRPQLVDKGLQLYNAAVKQLRSDIHARSPLQVLATTAIFTFYELCDFGSEQNPGWLYHLAGIAAVLQALGPEMVSVEPYLQVFSFCRMIFIVHGLNRHRRVCAASRLWTHVPFKNHTKSEFHLFFDIATEVAEWLEEVDSLEKSFVGQSPPDTISEQPGQVLQRAVDLIQKLKRWGREARVPLVNGSPRLLTSLETGEESSYHTKLRGYPSKLPFQAVATFDSLQGARLMHIYWTVALMLYMELLDNAMLCSQLDDIRDLFSDGDAGHGLGPGATSPTRTLVEEECRALANNIALYGSFCCQNLWQSFGTMVSTFSLKTAIRWYAKHGSGTVQESDLEGHCRALLDTIKSQVEDSETSRAFQDATFDRDDVLSRRWC